MQRAIGRVFFTPPMALFILFVSYSALTLSGCSHLAYQPSNLLYYTPASLGLEGVELSIDVPSQDSKDSKNAKDSKVYAWYLRGVTPPSKKPKGLVIQFHGNAENMSSHYLSLAWMVKAGYSLLTFDYRGYGKSPGYPSQRHTYEDALAVLEYAWKLYERDLLLPPRQTSKQKSKQKNKKTAQDEVPRFVVIGQSLGGAILARALPDFSRKDDVSLVVLDSTFMSYRKAARGLLYSRWWSAPLGLFTGLLMSDEFESSASVAQLTQPLLVIHDQKDPVVAFENGQEIFDRATTEPKHFWVLDRGRHLGVFANDEMQRRSDFIKIIEDSRPRPGPKTKS